MTSLISSFSKTRKRPRKTGRSYIWKRSENWNIYFSRLSHTVKAFKYSRSAQATTKTKKNHQPREGCESLSFFSVYCFLWYWSFSPPRAVFSSSVLDSDFFSQHLKTLLATLSFYPSSWFLLFAVSLLILHYKIWGQSENVLSSGTTLTR